MENHKAMALESKAKIGSSGHLGEGFRKRPEVPCFRKTSLLSSATSSCINTEKK